MAMNEPREPEPQSPAEAADGFLPCGRDLAELWDQQDRPRAGLEPWSADPHTAECRHCAAALEDFARLRDAVRRDGQETGADWEADAARLTAGIMDVVRLELRPGRVLALGEADEDAWMYEAVAARVFRTAAELVPGVRAGSCRISPTPSSDTQARTQAHTQAWTPARTPAQVRIEVSVDITRDLQLTADLVRRGIAAAAEHELGMNIASIDVAVTDIHHQTSGEEPR
ncbi:hypothetical protein ACFRJ1_09290 [Streptomyces sp. NPDC056773]|uniref:hypothetical protein n=1 Tax=unclassified Streptomyces TaxID=2593676 RepID=UPI003682D446